MIKDYNYLITPSWKNTICYANKTYYSNSYASFTPKTDRLYVLATFFICKSKCFLKMANTIEGYRCLDKSKGTDINVVNHDESYINKYFEEYKSEFLVNNDKLIYPEWLPDHTNAKILVRKKRPYIKIDTPNGPDIYTLKNIEDDNH